MAKDDNQEARKIAIEKMHAARRESEKEEKYKVRHDDTVTAIDEGGVKAASKRFLGVTKVDEDIAKMDLTTLKNVKVYSPFRVYFDEAAYSVSAENGTGPFDILPGHKNFLSLLKPCTLVIRNRRGTEEIDIDRGVIHVNGNLVTIFLDV